jgi:hypothetical protein
MSYNGWTNYATWRVNLEMFDGFNPRDHWQGKFDSAYDLGQALKSMAEDIICDQAAGDESSLARDYALAFLDDVNWCEIAEHVCADAE